MDHDWHRILRENMDYNEEHIYDDIDMRNRYAVGFWVGALAGILGTIILCLVVGLSYSGWVFP